MARIYFGYGSNMWKSQMKTRCPQSRYLGIGRLKNYKWIINERGYANIVQLPSQSTSDIETSNSHTSETWGLVYTLETSDEAQLDINEGFPEAYTRENVMVDFWPVREGGGVPDPSAAQPESVEMLVYIDRKRVESYKPKREYIFRMNKGIKDAVNDGVPVGYIEEVLRKFIPDVQDEGVEELARKQAALFEDET